MAIIQVPDALSQLPETLLQILVNKQRLEQSAEDLKLRQSEFKMRQEEFTFEKQEREEQRTLAQGRVNEILRRAQAGDPQALQVIQQSPLGAAARGGQGQQIAQLTQGLGQRGAQGAPSPIEALQERVRLQRLRAGVVAGPGGQAIGRALDVGELGGTVSMQDAIADPAGTAARLRETNAATRLNEANAGIAEERLRRPDTQAFNSAFNIWKAGAPDRLTWGRALREVGLPPVEDGINPNAVFVDPARSASANAEATKQAGFFVQMTAANNDINRLVEKTGGLTKLASFRRAITPDGMVSQAVAMGLNIALSPDQQELVQAQLLFSNLFRFSLSGQQSGVTEATRLQVVVAEEVGDSEQVEAAKRKTREIMIDVTRMRAEGGITRTQGMDIIIARSQALPPSAIAVLRQQRADAVLADAIEAGGGQVFTSAPSTPSTPQTIVDDVAVTEDALQRLIQGSNP